MDLAMKSIMDGTIVNYYKTRDVGLQLAFTCKLEVS